jgi:hypothetical protein
MGKGSTRRPGSGFHDGWDRIFSKANNPDEEELAIMQEESSAIEESNWNNLCPKNQKAEG